MSMNKTMIITDSEFVKREIAQWGEDYVDDLFSRGFVPVLIVSKDGVKWIWRLDKPAEIC